MRRHLKEWKLENIFPCKTGLNLWQAEQIRAKIVGKKGGR